MRKALSLAMVFLLLGFFLPSGNAQVSPFAAVSIDCDDQIYEFQDSLTNESVVVQCTITNPTAWTEVISLSSSTTGFTIEMETFEVGSGSEQTVNVTLTNAERIGKSTISNATVNATVIELNDAPPPNDAYAESNVSVHRGLYRTNGCTTMASTSFEYVVLEIGRYIENNLTDLGNITVKLNHSAAPIHSANFALLAEMGCYDSTIFHRVVDNFLIQGGDFTNNDGTGGHSAFWDGYCNGETRLSSAQCNVSEWSIRDEADNGLVHEPYVISMAKTSQANSGGSQFFITPSDSQPTNLDGVYTVFGEVFSGFLLVDEISETDTESGDRPTNDYIITNSYSYEGAEYADNDGDGVSDLLDSDDDNDGRNDTEDNCPFTPNSNQTDTDSDGLGDACDEDLDGDGIDNSEDLYPSDGNETSDFDGDGIGDNADPDDDNDGLNDESDAFPNDTNETLDTDGDGIGNNADADDDGDGVEDSIDNCQFTPNPEQEDEDGDGIGSECDGNESSESEDSSSVPAVGFVATLACLLIASRRKNE